VGTTTASANFYVYNAPVSYAGLNTTAIFSSSASQSTGTGGLLAFEGKYTSGGALANFAAIGGLKENSTDSNYSGYLGFYTRLNGSLAAERARIDSGGKLLLGVTSGTGLSNSDFAMVNGGSIRFRNAANSAYISAFYFNPSNGLDIGTGGSLSTITFGISGIGTVATFDTSGNFIIGSTNAQLQLNATTNNGNIAVISSAANANLNLASKGAGSINFNATGGFYCTQIYSTAVGGTNRAVYSDNTGTIGYLSSVRASKINIENITNASWLMQLNPVKFNYRKKDKDGNYTEEFDNTIEYGLIAEEAEIIKQELCFYDEVDGAQVLRGVNYQKLVVPMLKAIQEQQALITTLTARITALEGA
jgi:hypothetical protein